MRYLVPFLLVPIFLFSQPTVGLLHHDSTKAFNGYTLFAPNTSTKTYLIDINGRLVHYWESDFNPKLSAYLLENGNLLRSASLSSPPNNPLGGFQLFEWDNTLAWEYYNGAQHHDIEYIPQTGNVLLIIEDIIDSLESINYGRDRTFVQRENYRIQSFSIIEVEQTGLKTGEIVWQWNARDHLIQDYDTSKLNYGVISDHPELININYNLENESDWLHPNSINYNEEHDQIIISNRNINEVWIIDHSTTTEQAASHEGGKSGKGGDLLYRWGNPAVYGHGDLSDQKLHGQHDAHWINDSLNGGGNILIFNNGFPLLNHSSVDEIVLPSQDLNGNYARIDEEPFGPGDLIWQYTTDPLDRFLSPRYGGAQRLPNGNTLICNSESGEFLEVTNTKEIVWQYISPVTAIGALVQGTADIGKNQVFRCYRYGPNYSAFTGKDLSPGDPIEIYPTIGTDDEITTPTQFYLFDNYPNPFNPSTTIEFSIIDQSLVTITIYDILGNEIRRLLNDTLEPGLNNITWNGLDSKGNPVSSGVYLYNLNTGQNSLTKKMILLR